MGCWLEIETRVEWLWNAGNGRRDGGWTGFILSSHFVCFLLGDYSSFGGCSPERFKYELKGVRVRVQFWYNLNLFVYWPGLKLETRDALVYDVSLMKILKIRMNILSIFVASDMGYGIGTVKPHMDVDKKTRQDGNFVQDCFTVFVVVE